MVCTKDQPLQNKEVLVATPSSGGYTYIPFSLSRREKGRNCQKLAPCSVQGLFPIISYTVWAFALPVPTGPMPGINARTQNKLSSDGDSHYTKRSLSKGKTLHWFRNQILFGSLMKATVFPPEKFMSSLNTKHFIKSFRNFTSFLKLKGI